MEQMGTAITLAQDNKLPLSRQNYTPIEKRCLYYVIKEVRRIYVDKNLRADDKPYQDLFSDMYIDFKPQNLRVLGERISDVYDSLKRLRGKEIVIDTDDVWITTSWILQAKHDKKADVYTVQVSKEIMPYLVELSSYFTEYSLTVALTLKSSYSQRFYEFCCMYKHKGRFFLEVEKLLYMLKLEDNPTYNKNTGELKRTVLNVAQKELQELYDAGQCDLYFTYRNKETVGRKILSFWFEIHTQASEEQKRIEFASAQNQLRRILEISRGFILNDKNYIRRIESALNLNPTMIRDVLTKLNKIVNNYPKRDIPKIIRTALKDDFGIN